MPENKHIHLIGICGTAMASLAGMLQRRGFRVTGSDTAAYPPMSDFLAVPRRYSSGAAFAVQNLQPQPDPVVVGNAISRGNGELEQVLDFPKGIPFWFCCPRFFTMNFSVAKKCWSSQARTAKPQRHPCSRGFSTLPACNRLS